MATITNEVQRKFPKPKDKSKESNDPEDEKVRVIQTPTELQRLKLEKLMKNPSKEAFIPEKSKEKGPRGPLEFIRNIWGSSAGAGSGDFHVYRGVRRREYARQKFMNEKAKTEELDEEYFEKVEKNKKEAEEKTAKKRAKRQRKKDKLKAKRMKKKETSSANEAKESSSSAESEEDEKE